MYENSNGNTNEDNGFYPLQEQTVSVAEVESPVAVTVPQKEKKPSKIGNFFKKTLMYASMGLCFGLFAAVGFYAVMESVGMVTSRKEAQEESVDEVMDAEELKAWLLEEIDKEGVDVPVVHGDEVVIANVDATQVVEQTMPSMVSIANEYVARVSYFGSVVEQRETASGSGIIIGENETELLIATNYHVIADAEKLTVHFIDDEEVEAVVKGTDSDMDLAVLAVKKSDMKEKTINAISIATMGDSDELKLGEPVVAIGNALGYGLSVTGGYVSALDREVTLEDGSVGIFIQTDAAINPGNSGGALIDMEGKVIGINSNKIGGTVIEGIGYAIPISAAHPILKDLMSYETRTKVDEEKMGYLGIIPQTVTADVSEVYDMPKGVFVSQVEPGTPAEDAGLCRGDIIKKMGSKNVSTADELRENLQYYEAGETIDLVVMRMNQTEGIYEEITIQVKLGTRPVE